MPVEQKKRLFSFKWTTELLKSFWLEFLFFLSSSNNKNQQVAVVARYLERIKCYIKWEGKIIMINWQNLSNRVSITI